MMRAQAPDAWAPRMGSAARLLAGCVLFGAVAACGGGGGSTGGGSGGSTGGGGGGGGGGGSTGGGGTVVNGQSISTLAPTNAPRDFETTQYRASAAALVGASEAYARGGFGQGVRVGIVDTGVSDPLGLYGARLLSDPGYARGSGIGVRNDHGSLIASIIGAPLGGSAPIHGVAPQVELVSYDANEGGSLNSVSIDSVGDAFEAAGRSGVDFVNLSYSYDDQAGDPYRAGERFFRKTVAAADAGVVFVVSAGNAQGDEVSTLAAVPLYADDLARRLGLRRPGKLLDQNWIAVTGLDQSGERPAPNANACGLMMNSCLAAHYVAVPAIDADGDVARSFGTSFAAPQVVGALAALKSMYPALDNETIAEILLRTADDLGAPGVDPIFGRGRLNLARAAQPVGGLSAPPATDPVDIDIFGNIARASLRVSSATASALKGMMRAGPAFAVVDEYGRGFSVDMAAFSREVRARFRDDVAAYAARRDVLMEVAPGVTLRFASGADPAPRSARIRFGGAGFGFGQGEGALDAGAAATLRAVSDTDAHLEPDGFRHPVLGLAEDATALSARAGPLEAMAVFGEDAGGDAFTAFAATASAGGRGARAVATVGVARESAAFLGASGAEAFAMGRSDTAFASVAGRVEVARGVALIGDAHLGWTRIGNGPGALDGGDARAAGWRVGAEARSVLGRGDAIQLAFGAPFTVIGGAMRYRASTTSGAQRRRASLSGEAPLHLEAGWTTPLGPQSDFGLAGAAPLRGEGEPRIGLRWRGRF